MGIKKVSVSDMFSMLLASFRLIGKHPGRFAFASFLSLLIIIVLVVILIGVLFATIGLSQLSQLALTMQDPSTEFLIYFYAVMILFGLVFIPLMAGWLKLCQNSAEGQHATAFDIFLYYGLGSVCKKLLYYSVISLVAYLCVTFLFRMLCLAFGIDFSELETALVPQAGADPLAILHLGTGFWIAYFCMLIVGMLMQFMFYLGFSHTTLTDNSAIGSVKAGVGGVLKNLLTILAFSIIAFIVMLVVVVLAALVIGLIIYLLILVHEMLAVFVAAALYLGIILFIYPLMFAFQYYFWNGILGNETENPTPELNNPEISI